MEVDFLIFVKFFERICEHVHNLFSLEKATVVLIVLKEDFVDDFVDLVFSEAHWVEKFGLNLYNGCKFYLDLYGEMMKIVNSNVRKGFFWVFIDKSNEVSK